MQYSDAQLYNQLRYYMSLFDIDKAHDVASGVLKGGQSPHNSPEHRLRVLTFLSVKICNR